MNFAPCVLHLLLPALSIGAILVSTARAASLNLSATADATVSSANPDNNYGGAGALAVSAAGLPKGEFQSVLKFDLSSAKASFDTTFGVANWTLQSAILQLTAGTPTNALFNTSAAGQLGVSWMQNYSWTEGAGTPQVPGATGITFNTLPGFLSAADQSLGTFAFNGSAGTNNYALTLGSGIITDATVGSLAAFRLSAADANVSAFLNSRSFNGTTTRPVLTLTAVAVPEPTSWLLACVGIAGLAWFRRRVSAR